MSLDKPLAVEDFDKLKEGFHLEDGFIQADELEYVKDSKRMEVGIEIHSGRNRIVRRMFEHLGKGRKTMGTDKVRLGYSCCCNRKEMA